MPDAVPFSRQFTLRDVLSSFVAELTGLPDASRLDLDFDFPDELFGDAAILRQALGSMVEVTVETLPDTQISIHGEMQFETEEFVTLRFAGPATGIPVDAWIRTLYPSGANGESTSARMRELGRRLVLASENLKMKHGRLWIEGAGSSMSTFQWILNLRRTPPNAMHASENPASPVIIAYYDCGVAHSPPKNERPDTSIFPRLRD